MAKGFSQKPHLDYTEMFAPVAKFASLCTVLAIAAVEDMEVHSMDISSAFLNGDLEEEIYMAQPKGFAAPGQEHLWAASRSHFMVLSRVRDSGTKSCTLPLLSWVSPDVILITVSGSGLRMALE